jgi:uncharacterized membrane protein YkvA (DUF1232 family)
MPRPQFIPDWKKVLAYLRDPHSDWKPKILFVLAIVYVLWPLDLFPDLVPFFGWFDDIGVGILAVWYLVSTSMRLPPGSKS